MWEIDVVSIMKEDFIEKDKDCSKYGLLFYPRWPPVPRDPLGLCWYQISVSALIFALIKSLPYLENTLLGDGEMEKYFMCRMNRDFIVFMRPVAEAAVSSTALSDATNP